MNIPKPPRSRNHHLRATQTTTISTHNTNLKTLILKVHRTAPESSSFGKLLQRKNNRIQGTSSLQESNIPNSGNFTSPLSRPPQRILQELSSWRSYEPERSEGGQGRHQRGAVRRYTGRGGAKVSIRHSHRHCRENGSKCSERRGLLPFLLTNPQRVFIRSNLQHQQSEGSR